MTKNRCHTSKDAPDSLIAPGEATYRCSDCDRMRSIPRVITFTGASYCIDCVIKTLTPMVEETA